jgi:hypothetical protein
MQTHATFPLLSTLASLCTRHSTLSSPHPTPHFTLHFTNRCAERASCELTQPFLRSTYPNYYQHSTLTTLHTRQTALVGAQSEHRANNNGGRLRIYALFGTSHPSRCAICVREAKHRQDVNHIRLVLNSVHFIYAPPLPIHTTPSLSLLDFFRATDQSIYIP